MLRIAAKPVVDATRESLVKGVAEFKSRTGRVPKLTAVIVGENPASMLYVANKSKMAEEMGMIGDTLRLPATSSSEDVRKVVDRLNTDASIDGILIQRPLPSSFKEEEVLHWVSPEKDVDAFHPINVGRLSLGLPCLQPCTPAGVMALLKHYKIEVSGKVTCVIGRSSIVGKPMGMLLLQANATVIQAHSKTPDLAGVASQADILITAVGKPGFITADYVKKGAVVIDVGINRTPEGKVVGDVDFEAVSKVASAITPVPGGVGPMTILMLLKNTLSAAQARV